MWITTLILWPPLLLSKTLICEQRCHGAILQISHLSNVCLGQQRWLDIGIDIDIDSPVFKLMTHKKIVPMDSICNSWNGFFGRLSVFVSFLWCTYLFLMFWMPVFFSLCTTFCPSKITSLIVQQAPRRSPQFWSHVVPLWSIQVQKWPGHVNYTSGTNSRSICTSSFHLKHCFTNSYFKYSAN